jgi:hypothetical protein
LARFSEVSLSAAACLTPPNNLVGWWPGEGNPNDIISTNNGSLQNGATATAAGLNGQCFSFNGVNSYVQIPDAPALKPTNLTIEAWVKFASLDSSGFGAPAGDQYIVFKQNSHVNYFEGYDVSKTRLGGKDVFRFEIGSVSGAEIEIDSTTPMTTNVWYHFAAVRGSNFMQLYVNGQLQAQTNVSFPQDYGTLPLFFGTSGTTYWDRRLNGLLDEVSLYNRALSSNEISAIYDAGAAGKCKPLPPPPQVVNLPGSRIRADQATLNGQILTPGSEAPAVTIYYGPVDGGTNAGAWAQAVGIGFQTGPFAQTVSGLSSNTAYFYTAKASNSVATVWAAPSQAFTTLATNPVQSVSAVLTHHNDLSRTGANPKENQLDVYNVNTNQFGLLCTRIVDDQIYAQPLVMTNATIPGKGTRNVVIVATVKDTVYAFDADDPTVSAPYWQTSFLGSNVFAPATDDIPNTPCGTFRNISGYFGIIGTPVIDPATMTLYVVARTKELGFNTTNFVQKLHALDINTGAERSNSPVTITATYPGTGTGSVSGVLTFDALRENQRSALALVNGIVYIGWASHCDWNPYHGWLMGYDAATLQREVVYNTSPNGQKAGIWMSGGAPAADDSGNLYLSIGNGTVGTTGNPRDLTNRGESFLKLSPNGTNFTIASWFTPYNWPNLEASDIDLGSAEVLLIPGTTLAFSGSKQGVAYLVNRDNMGGLSAGNDDTNIVQSFSVTPYNIHGGPVWWDGPFGSYAYLQGEVDYLRQYRFDRNANLFQIPSYAQSPTPAAGGMPGGMLAVSSDGAGAGTGIVWSSRPFNGDANGAVVPGILLAYNAENVSHELWNSEQLSARDRVGNFAKFCPPTVANGKVYLATFSNRLNVYGLFPIPSLAISLSAGQAFLTWPTNSYYTYKLQANTNLVSGTWADQTNVPSVSNGSWQVTVPASSTAKFYRLKR